MKIELLSKILKISDSGNQIALEFIRVKESVICILPPVCFKFSVQKQTAAGINSDRSSTQKTQLALLIGTWHFQNYKDYNFIISSTFRAFHVLRKDYIVCF